MDRPRTLLADQAVFAGSAVRQPTRWAIVPRLITVDAPDATDLSEAERRRDQSFEAVKDAIVARAAVPSPSVKAEYFKRYFDDVALNEAWASESLPEFNPVEQASLTLPYLRPALDRLDWIREHHRIFFLAAWIDGFVGGQVDEAALAIVDQFLLERPALPLDVRREVLIARDELALTARIRRGIV